MFGVELSEELKELKLKHNDPDSARVLFTRSKERINSRDCSPLDRAVAFYIVNKCSFSGLTESSSFSSQASHSNFSLRGIEKLPGYQEIISNWHINGHWNYVFPHMHSRPVSSRQIPTKYFCGHEQLREM